MDEIRPRRPWFDLADQARNEEVSEAIALYRRAARLARAAGCHALAACYLTSAWVLEEEDKVDEEGKRLDPWHNVTEYTGS